MGNMKKLKTKIMAWLTAGALLSSLAGVLVSITDKSVVAESESAAYFLTEDRYTQGIWYNGENGLKDNAQADRNYGTDGAVLFLHWLRENGQQTLNADVLNDFTHDTEQYWNGEKANYVEYPSYVTSIEGNITNVGETFEYWMNTPGKMSQFWNESHNGIQIIPIEGPYHDGTEFKFSHGGFSSKVGAPTQFTVEMSDDEWHTFTYYVGCPYRHKYTGYDQQWVKIFDLNGNLLAQHCVDNVNQGVHVRFAIKGSFMVHFEGNSLEAWSNAMFFDPYVERADIQAKDLSVTLEGARTLNLAWTNPSADTYTTVFRRIKGEKLWDFIAEVGPGVNTYSDTTAKVATTYEYALASGTQKTATAMWNGYHAIKESFIQPDVRVKTYNIVDGASLVEIKTADYNATKLEFEQKNYISNYQEASTVKARLFKTDDQGATWQPYAGVEVTFSLTGESVFSELGINSYKNMNDAFGKGVTDENGYVEVTGMPEYVGDYVLLGTVAPQPNPQNELLGYDGTTAETNLSVIQVEDPNPKTPLLTTISDAIKPGNTVNLMGFNMEDDGELKIAYKKNEGRAPTDFDEAKTYSYIREEELLFVDSVNGTGVMFVFPKDERCGVYDFYVHNANGWSNGITMNVARPLYLDQEAAYAGQEIQIVGRNFLQYEYGVGTLESSLKTLRVKLTQIADENGKPISGISYILSQDNGGILTGNKIDKEDALQFENDILQAEDIPYTHELRITVKIPQVYAYGTYWISVAADGKDYRDLTMNCPLQIVEKKAQNWDTTVFGAYSDAHVGNDPLDLGVYWAQDLNYTNVVTMTPNESSTAKAYTDSLNTTISTLSAQGGGVVYFPEGTYYVWSEITLKEGVILVGAGEDKTTLEYMNNVDSGKIWFKSTSASNSGIARLSMNSTHEELHTENGWYVPNYIVKWDGTGEYNDDKTYSTIKNRFLINVSGQYLKNVDYAVSKYNKNISINGQNVVLKHCVIDGGKIDCEMNSYGTMWDVKMIFHGQIETSPHWIGKYSFMENCYMDLNYNGHGPSQKSDQYVGYTYVSHAGNRVDRMNDGEVLLFEPPTGAYATGYVIGAEKRNVTLDFVGTTNILAGTLLGAGTSIRYNMCAIYIMNGTGQGQYRYIKASGKTDYKNCYEFQDWERDWDILPDHTSTFTIIAPLANITVKNVKGYDCTASITFYNNIMDGVIKGCYLVDTGGISVWGTTSGGIANGKGTPTANVRVVDNYMKGVGSNYNEGYSLYPGAGGLLVEGGGSGDFYGGAIRGVTIRNNYVCDLLPDVENYDSPLWNFGTGILVYHKGGQDNNPNGMRYIIMEDNVCVNSEWGLWTNRTVTGVIFRNNQVSGTTMLDTDVTVDRPVGFYGSAYHTLYVNGEASHFSGEYQFETALPELPSQQGKTFLGWTEDEIVTSASMITMKAFGENVTLYAVYGCEVVFDYNYLKSNGDEKGDYTTVKVMEGNTVQAEIISYGDPFRMGYEFGGWYLDKACTQEFDTTAAVTSSVRVYAKWIGEDEGPIVTPPTSGSESSSDNNDNKVGCGCSGGCQGSLGNITSVILGLGVALLAMKREKFKHK